MKLKLYKLDTKLDFGKYKGQTITQVIETDPQYIEWCATNVDGFTLSKTAVEDLETALEGWDDWNDSLYEDMTWGDWEDTH